MDGDPDALWKPGFAGEIVYPDRPGRLPGGSGASPRERRRRRRPLVLIALLTVPIVIGTVVATWPERDDAPLETSAVRRVPRSVDDER